MRIAMRGLGRAVSGCQAPISPDRGARAPAMAGDEVDHVQLARAGQSLSLHGEAAAQVLDAAQSEHAAGLEASDAKLVAAVNGRLSRAEEAVAANATLLARAAELSGAPHDPPPEALADALRDLPAVTAVLARLAGDWGDAGGEFRDAFYGPVVAAVTERVEESDEAVRALVPGAGLGRLAWELAAAGADVQGAEDDFLALFLANAVLNGSGKRTKFFPHAMRFADVRKGTLESEEFPDVDPGSLRADASLAMRAGAFLALYDEAEEWDCVATAGFLDGAHNAIAYVRRVAKILKPGGVWVNHGGFDFRFADDLDEPSIELTEEELMELLPKVGLRVVKEERRKIRMPDADDALVRETIGTVFFVAVKDTE